MMLSTNRPYITIPKLIEQPTWGGSYIVGYKGWEHKTELSSKKYGQSYELSGKSLLRDKLFDSSDVSFDPEGSTSGDTVPLVDLIATNPERVLGPNVVATFHTMPILIKFTQALGNSFQLHRTPGASGEKWEPKAESWYFFEDGVLTLGIKKGIDIGRYKEVCLRIEAKMKQLSEKVRQGIAVLLQAKQEAMAFIKNEDPWQFVNTQRVAKHTLVDLSGGGLHHSWEEDPASSLGNIIYEVQQDVPDDVSTVRSFDQGKFKEDGSVRTIHIEDYFRLLDTEEKRNNFTSAQRTPQGRHLLSTSYYSLDVLEIEKAMQESTGASFNHLFVREGAVEISTSECSIKLTKGHSCFIPHDVRSYHLKSLAPTCIVLKTFIEV